MLNAENISEFTFVVITFNQEKYILENLESTKFLIQQYGRDIKIDFIISDDCSVDRTVDLAKRWLNENSQLFREITVLTGEMNVGTVKNMQRAISAIKTRHFKLLAGDDLYYKENIFDLVSNNEMVITPSIRYNGEFAYMIPPSHSFYTYIRKEKCLKSYIKNKMKYHMCIETPGVFYDYFLLNEDLWDELGKFKLIEDVAMWSYLLRKKETVVKINFKPHVIYRVDTGISHKKGRRNLKYDADLLLIDNLYLTRKNYEILHIHPYKFIYAISSIYFRITNLFCQCVREEKEYLKQCEKECEKHIELIQNKVNTYDFN